MKPIFNLILDFLFPPLCLSCSEKVETKFLCPACWELCALPDPIERCRHCFEELEEGRGMCGECMKEPLIKTPRAFVFDRGAPIRFKVDQLEGFAAFMIYQWIQLDLTLPDWVIPMPDPISKKLAKEIAKSLSVRYGELLQEKGGEIKLRKELEEDLDLLLIDYLSPLSWLDGASSAISVLMPKRALLLSLFRNTSSQPACPINS